MKDLTPTRGRIQSIVLSWLGWSLAGVLYTFVIIGQTPSAPFFYVLPSVLLSMYLYALLSIAVRYWTILLFDRPWPLQIIGHPIGAVMFGVIWYFAYEGLFILIWGAELLEMTGMTEQYLWMILTSTLVYGVVAGIFHTGRYRQRMHDRELEQRELLLYTSRIELAVLKSQLNPHFLFNTLNTVNALIGEDAERARNVVVRLADTLRYSLESDRRPMVRLDDELRFIRTYLEIERERFGDRLRATVDLDEEDRALFIPPMILQPLVENAVRHGIAPQESGGTVRLTIRRAGKRLRFEVDDDGVGHPGPAPEEIPGTGHGLRNTDRRLRKIFGDESRLHIESGTWGFRVHFSLPIVEQSPHHQPIADDHAALRTD